MNTPYIVVAFVKELSSYQYVVEITESTYPGLDIGTRLLINDIPRHENDVFSIVEEDGTPTIYKTTTLRQTMNIGSYMEDVMIGYRTSNPVEVAH